MKELWADPDGPFRRSLLPGGAMRRNLDEGWAEGGVYDVMIEKLWAPGGACRLMVEDRDSAFWAGIARRRAATEARWAEQRKAHAASGRAGRFFAYGTDFAGVRCLSERFHLCLRVGDGVLFESYDDEHVAALAHDIVRMACGGEALNYPKRGFCLAADGPIRSDDAAGGRR